MFKIGRIDQVNSEEVTIELKEFDRGSYRNGKTTYTKVETLSFLITGNDYSFSFMLNCHLEKLLEIPMNQMLDFKSYLFHGETLLNRNIIEDEDFDIKIYKYLENEYEITIHFCTNEEHRKNYAGVIVFDFNLDKYLNEKKS